MSVFIRHNDIIWRESPELTFVGLTRMDWPGKKGKFFAFAQRCSRISEDYARRCPQDLPSILRCFNLYFDSEQCAVLLPSAEDGQLFLAATMTVGQSKWRFFNHELELAASSFFYQDSMIRTPGVPDPAKQPDYQQAVGAGPSWKHEPCFYLQLYVVDKNGVAGVLQFRRPETTRAYSLDDLVTGDYCAYQLTSQVSFSTLTDEKLACAGLPPVSASHSLLVATGTRPDSCLRTFLRQTQADWPNGKRYAYALIERCAELYQRSVEPGQSWQQSKGLGILELANACFRPDRCGIFWRDSPADSPDLAYSLTSEMGSWMARPFDVELATSLLAAQESFLHASPNPCDEVEKDGSYLNLFVADRNGASACLQLWRSEEQEPYSLDDLALGEFLVRLVVGKAVLK